MSDIVERLRARYDWNKPMDDLCHEGADEIERLRALIADNPEGRVDTSGEVQRLRDEIRRLHADITKAKDLLGTAIGVLWFEPL